MELNHPRSSLQIKKMRSNKSKEFFAELKVLCKIHHINVLLGYASHQPLSSTARTQIALDAVKGIEYIHDHTKARYVHRDIKTSNILLDETLRAKKQGKVLKASAHYDCDLVDLPMVGLFKSSEGICSKNRYDCALVDLPVVLLQQLYFSFW
ncbi:unnamed protein product [Camellia sinensis]